MVMVFKILESILSIRKKDGVSNFVCNTNNSKYYISPTKITGSRSIKTSSSS